MHPLLFPLGSDTRWKSFLEHEMKWDEESLVYADKLLTLKRLPLITGKEIAVYLGLTEKLVQFIRYRPEKFYTTFQVPKKNGSLRTIQAPRLYLKVIQHYILDCILSTAKISDSAFGFRPGASPAGGAQIHAGCRYLWNTDIRDFFPTIKKAQVVQAFQVLGYTLESSNWLSAICCLNEALPQGAPTSPTLSNIVFHTIDLTVEEICRSKNIQYSRYADDLSFSSQTPIPSHFQDEIISLLRRCGFEVHPGKSRLMGPMCRREVTGLTVNEEVSIPRQKRRIIRSLFHKVSLDPSEYTLERSKIAGIAGWVAQHHPDLGERYMELVHLIPHHVEKS